MVQAPHFLERHGSPFGETPVALQCSPTMSSVIDLLHLEPPATLFHYTDQRGLLGILQAREIWASHTQYLNDQQEFRHALGVAREVLSEMRANREQGAEAERFDEMEFALDNVEAIHVCVCSFSEAADVLSQWRAYGGKSAGFSIGFSGAFLKAVADKEGFILTRCIYDELQQRTRIRGLLGDVLAENLWRHSNLSRGADDYLPPGGNLVSYLNKYAPILKHSSFAEEKEWRIISRPLSCCGERFGYREGKSMLIPFYRIPLHTPEHPFRVAEVVIGPTPYALESERSVKGLLVRCQLPQSTKRSSVPYRNW